MGSKMGLKRTVIKVIKNSSAMYKLYTEIFNWALRIGSCFVPVQKKILFTSFNGDRYDDSPRVLYEKMIRMPEFAEYDFVWAFRKPDEFEIPIGRKIGFDSFSYYKEAMTSKIWITNVSIERGLHFKRKETIYVNTWHGTPLKKLNDPATKHAFDDVDVFCVQNDYSEKIMAPLYKLKNDAVLLSDYPRNDGLLTYTKADVLEIKKELGIPEDKIVILYMPTYRAFTKDKKNNLYVAPPINLQYWKKALGNQYVVLFRLHYLVEKQLDIPNDGFSYSVTKYPKLNDLYAVADILISDYSSVFFDYSILERPMLCFPYDKKDYIKYTGLYMGLEKLPCKIAENEKDLVAALTQIDYKKESERVAEFKKEYAPKAGCAGDIVIKEVIKQINDDISEK